MYVINYALCAACRESPPEDVVYHFKGMFKRTRAGAPAINAPLTCCAQTPACCGLPTSWRMSSSRDTPL